MSMSQPVIWEKAITSGLASCHLEAGGYNEEISLLIKQNFCGITQRPGYVKIFDSLFVLLTIFQMLFDIAQSYCPADR